MMKRGFLRVVNAKFFTKSQYTPNFFNHSYYESKQFPFTTVKLHAESASNKRIKYDYWANISAALRLPISNDVLNENKSDQHAQLFIARDFIREHAARRVDLFFYTLIAYYKSNLQVQKGRTVLQHGKGRSVANNVNVTQACHSSFFGSFIDNVEDDIQSPQFGKGQSILSDTHFSDSLSATVELPAFVNKLDDELEVTCMGRDKSLLIISDVSRGIITPAQGLTNFLSMMNNNFNDLEKNKKLAPNSPPYLSRKSPEATPEIKSHVISLERSGTLDNKWCGKSESVNYEYTDMLLRLTLDEKYRCKVSEVVRDKIYNHKYQMLQIEILTSKTDKNDQCECNKKGNGKSL